MTAEQQHIFEYLKDFLTKNWNNLSEYAKENPDTRKPYKNVKQLIKEIESDTDNLEWFFIDCLSQHVKGKDVLGELRVFGGENDDYNIYEVNGKYVKVWYKEWNAQYQFVERKDFEMKSVNEDLQSIIDRLTKENEELKLKLKLTNNENLQKM